MDGGRDPQWTILEHLHDLCKAYILGDFLGSPNFRNAVMKALIEKAQMLVEVKGDIMNYLIIVPLVYKSTHPESPFDTSFSALRCKAWISILSIILRTSGKEKTQKMHSTPTC